MHVTRLLLSINIILFCLITTTEVNFAQNKNVGQNTTTEKTAPNNITENLNTLPLYYIPQLNFEGNKHFNQRKLRNLFQWQTKKAYSRNEIVAGFDRIINTYRQNGFVFAQITPTATPTASQSIQLSVKVREGKRLRNGNFTFIGNRLFSQDELRRQLGLRKGRFYALTALEQGIVRIQQLYSEHGHPKVEIRPTISNLSPLTGNMDISLLIQEGVKVRLSHIKVSGLKKTKNHVVIREIPIKTYEIFDQRKIDQSYHRLRNIGLFHSIQPNLLEEGLTEDTIIFHAKVTEARTGRLVGVLGYAPPVEGLDSVPQLTGVVEMRETNLLGTGRDVNFYWKSGLLTALQVGYKEPWIFGKPINMGITYSQLKQRNPFNNVESEERAASLSGNTKFGSFYESEITLGYKQIRYANTTAPLPVASTIDTFSPTTNANSNMTPTTFDEGSKYSITFRLTRDSRDYFINPTRGRHDSIAVELSSSVFRLRKIWVDMQQYYQTWKNQIIAVELHAAVAWGVNIPPTELFYLGGATTLRGYDEDWFSGPRRVHSNIEYRFLTGQNSQIFTFLDFGSVTFIDRPSVFDKLRIGYGFGARLESKNGIIQLDYGLAAGDSALRGKVHVKLGASF